MKTHILFVCLGNICRSPSAEAVFKDRIRSAGLEEAFEVDSAGILSEHRGCPADSRMRRHARKRGYELTSISRPVTPEDFERFDFIYGMDAWNLEDLYERAPDETARKKCRLLLDCVPDAGTREVPDPYYGGAAGFEEVLDLVEIAADSLLELHRP